MSDWWFIDLWKWFHPNASFERENRLVIFTLFATQGVVLIFGNGSIRSIAKGDFCGEELLAWKFESASYSNPPLSTTYVKSQTKEIIMHSQIICLRHTTRWEFDLHFQQRIMTKQPILTPPLVLCGLIKPRKIQALSNYNYLAKLKLSIIIFVIVFILKGWSKRLIDHVIVCDFSPERVVQIQSALGKLLLISSWYYDVSIWYNSKTRQKLELPLLLWSTFRNWSMINISIEQVSWKWIMVSGVFFFKINYVVCHYLFPWFIWPFESCTLQVGPTYM